MLADPVGHETEKADFRESFGEDVEEETAHEGFRLEGHGFQRITMTPVAVVKVDSVVGKGSNPVVGNGDAVGVAAEVVDDVMRAVERGLELPADTIDVPWRYSWSENGFLVRETGALYTAGSENRRREKLR